MKNKILVVDDQPGIRLLLSDVFTSIGYHVTVAQTGQEALDKIFKQRFDLILLDHGLPIINGQEVIEQMEHKGIFVPVILMSGLIENLKREYLQHSMFIKIVAKPFNILEMSQMVKKMLS